MTDIIDESLARKTIRTCAGGSARLTFLTFGSDLKLCKILDALRERNRISVSFRVYTASFVSEVENFRTWETFIRKF